MKAKSNTSSNKAAQRPIEGQNLIFQMGKVKFALLKRGQWSAQNTNWNSDLKKYDFKAKKGCRRSENSIISKSLKENVRDPEFDLYFISFYAINLCDVNADCSTFIFVVLWISEKKICEFGQNNVWISNKKISGTYLGFTCFFFSWTPIV